MAYLFFCQTLQKKFEDFTGEVNTLGQNKLTTVQKLKQQVKSSEAQQREKALLNLWEELQKAMKIRAEVTVPHICERIEICLEVGHIRLSFSMNC